MMHNTINIIVIHGVTGPALTQYPLTEKGEAEAFEHFSRLAYTTPEETERAYKRGYIQSKLGSEVIVCESYLD